MMKVGIPREVNTKVTCHIGAKNAPIGAAAAALLAKKLNGKGAIIELGGTAGASAARRAGTSMRNKAAAIGRRARELFSNMLTWRSSCRRDRCCHWGVRAAPCAGT